MEIVNFRLHKRDRDQLREICADQGVTQSELLRALVTAARHASGKCAPGCAAEESGVALARAILNTDQEAIHEIH